MNQGLIEKWNAKVTEKDEIFVLGDFMFGNGILANGILNQLKGTKYLILGDHDYFVENKNFDQGLFKWVKDYYVVKENGNKIVLFHWPIQRWHCCHYGSIHLYGHIHSNMLQYPLKNAYNVGVDVNDFEPKTLSEILRE